MQVATRAVYRACLWVGPVAALPALSGLEGFEAVNKSRDTHKRRTCGEETLNLELSATYGWKTGTTNGTELHMLRAYPNLKQMLLLL